MSTLPVVQEQQGLAYRHELSVEELVLQVKKIHQVMAEVMRPGLEGHYGVIPGTKKPTLLKPGAELLCMLFRLAPEYASDCLRDGAHLNVKTTCTLRHIPTGMVWATGEALCSTREAKYAYRQSSRICPTCRKEDTIIKGREEYGGGWLCFAKKGGCGAKFKDGDATIEDQKTERVANPDIADTENTVLKIANKRSLIAAVLNATAASEVFTQDLDETNTVTDEKVTPPPVREPARAAPPTTQSDVLISDGQQKKLRAVIRGSGWGATDQEQETALHDMLAARQIAHVKDIPAALYDDILDTAKAGPKK